MQLIASVLLASLALPAIAQDAAPVALPPISSQLKRSKDVLPYQRINEVLLKMDRYGEGLFRMDFRISKQKTTVPLEKLRMVVRSDEADHPIKIDAEGRFTLPMLPEAEGRTADMATNAMPEDKVAVMGSVELTAHAEDLTMAKVRQIVRVGFKLREELLPFYLRWLFPRVEGVRVCSATPTWELEWRENGQLLGLALPPATGERDPEAKKGEKGRACTLLTGQENWPDAARLVPPADTKLSIKL